MEDLLLRASCSGVRARQSRKALLRLSVRTAVHKTDAHACSQVMGTDGLFDNLGEHEIAHRIVQSYLMMSAEVQVCARWARLPNARLPASVLQPPSPAAVVLRACPFAQHACASVSAPAAPSSRTRNCHVAARTVRARQHGRRLAPQRGRLCRMPSRYCVVFLSYAALGAACVPGSVCRAAFAQVMTG